MAEARSESSSRVAILRASVMAEENIADERVIVTESEKKNLNDITTMWIRSCPKCNKELKYNYKSSFLKSFRENKLCVRCVRIGTEPIKQANTKNIF